MDTNTSNQILLDTLRATLMTFIKAVLTAAAIFGLVLTESELAAILVAVDAGVNLVFLTHRIYRALNPVDEVRPARRRGSGANSG